MISKKILLPAAIALACGAGNASAYLLDFNGALAGGALQVGGIDPKVGNLISRCADLLDNCTTTSILAGGLKVDDVIETFGHAALDSGSFTDLNGDPVNFLVAGEWTLVFGFTEVVTAQVGLSATLVTIDTALLGTANFFEVYFQAAPNSSMLAGAGFNDGTLIMSGTIDAFDPSVSLTLGRSDFTVTDLGEKLDKFNADNYVGKTTLSTNGNVQLALTPKIINTAFFKDGLAGLTLTATSQINLPFASTNPSGCFVQTAGGFGVAPPDLGGAGASNLTAGCGDTIGKINGVTGPNVMFQSDANIALQQSVPEPTTLALLGGALFATGAVRRSRRKA